MNKHFSYFVALTRVCPCLLVTIGLIGVGLAGIGAAPAAAREVEGIAAIVNDEVISLFDVDQRVALFFATSGIQKTTEMKERLRAQVLRSLIDEKLQLQEARRVEISIKADEIDENIKRMAKANDMSLDGIQEFLSKHKIRENTLKGQVQAELAWNQFVRRNFGARIKIGEQEIDEQFNKAVRAISQPRFLVNEILLNLDALAGEHQVTELSNAIGQQLRAGVDFAAIAKQFSIAPSAARGGQLGWITTDQLDDTLKEVLKRMQPGQISLPIQTATGVYILALVDKKQGGTQDPMKNQFDVLRINFKTGTELASVNDFIGRFKTCRTAQKDAKKRGATVNRSGLREITKLPQPVQRAVANLEAGEVSVPQNTDQGLRLYVVCNRKDDLGIQISRDTISENIFSTRVAMMARRHLRDLRRDAVVEYR